MIGSALVVGGTLTGAAALADSPRPSPQVGAPGASPQEAGPYGIPSGAMAGGIANGATGATGPETTDGTNPATPPSYADVSQGAGGGGPGDAGAGGAGGPVAAPFGSQAALASGLGGGQGGSEGALVMLGDQLNISAVGVPPTPPIPNPPRSYLAEQALKAKTMVPYVRALKLSENQSPLPQDRVYFSFNYFNNVNGPVNGRLAAPVSGIQVYRYILGFEKTFLDGNASIGVRDSINTLSSSSPIQSLGGTSSAMGDLNVFFKYVIRRTGDLSNGPSLGGNGAGGPFATRGNGSLWSTGMSISIPTGPGQFAGSSFSRSYRNTELQPFIGYYYKAGRFYLQGFESLAIPLDDRDVLLSYSDVGIGYFVYQNNAANAWVTAVAPTFEAHINIPLTHRGVFNPTDFAGTADVVDLTYGTNILFGNKSLLSTGLSTPVTGPRPFNLEASAMFNYYYGSRRRPIAPPVIGQ